MTHFINTEAFTVKWDLRDASKSKPQYFETVCFFFAHQIFTMSEIFKSDAMSIDSK